MLGVLQVSIKLPPLPVGKLATIIQQEAILIITICSTGSKMPAMRSVNN